MLSRTRTEPVSVTPVKDITKPLLKGRKDFISQTEPALNSSAGCGAGVQQGFQATDCRRKQSVPEHVILEWKEAHWQDSKKPNKDYGTNFPRLFFIPRWPKLLSCAVLLVLVGLCLTVWKAALKEHVGLTGLKLLKYLSLPVVSVVFTYGHIWGALWMTFYPLEFFGIPGMQLPEQPWGLGWQGIVPSKVRKMASIFIRNFTEKLLTVDEIFAHLDASILAREVDGCLSETLARVIDEVGWEVAPRTWKKMPETVKEELILRVREESPQLLAEVLHEAKGNIDNIFDLEEMVVQALKNDKALLNHSFLSCGFNELEFIRDTGAYMGLFFGVVQMMQQKIYPAGWMLPVFGVVVGLLTNWLALKMIFEPVHPKPLLGGRIVLQGVFLTRQNEVAAMYSNIFAENLLTARKLVPALVNGQRAGALCDLIRREVETAMDRCAGSAQRMIAMSVGKEPYEEAKALATDRVIADLPTIFLSAEAYVDKAMNLEQLLTERVRSMDVADYEQLLHPAFQEDEWILILLGGILGFIVGMLQWHILGR